MAKKATLCASALLVIGAQVHAQTQPPAPALPEPMIQAVRQAVTTNPEVQARWHGFLAADEERKVARGGYFPRVDLTAGTGQEDRNTPGISYGTYSFNGVRLSLTQMLFDGMLTRNEVHRLGFAKLTRYYELVEASETVALEAVRAYADVVRYRELVEIAKQNYVAHRQTGDLVQGRVNAGFGRGVDAEQASGRLALAESNLLTELTNLHDVSARYLRIVGVRPPEVMPRLPAKVQVGTMPASTGVLLKDGLEGSPALNAAFENVRAHDKAIDSTKAAFMPRVDLRGYTSRDRNQTLIQPPAGHSRIDGVELLLNFNLFRGGSDVARQRKALNEHSQSIDLMEKTCRDVRQTLQIAYSDMNALNEQLQKLDRHRVAAEKSHIVYRQQYNLGQRTLLDLLDSQNEFFLADRAYINAHYGQIVAQARTLAGMGRLTPALNVRNAEHPEESSVAQDRDGIKLSEVCPLDTAEIDTLDKIKASLVIPPAQVVAPRTVIPSKVNLDADALFDFDKYVLKPAGKQALDELVDGLKDIDIEIVIVIGHTDSKGSEEYNTRLSLRRANSVRTYLVSKGIAGKRIRTEGRGETQPIADNATEEGRAQNRRVEIHVVRTSDKK